MGDLLAEELVLVRLLSLEGRVEICGQFLVLQGINGLIGFEELVKKLFISFDVLLQDFIFFGYYLSPGSLLLATYRRVLLVHEIIDGSPELPLEPVFHPLLPYQFDHLAGLPRVLACYYVRCGQGLILPEREIPQVAYRGRHDH